MNPGSHIEQDVLDVHQLQFEKTREHYLQILMSTANPGLHVKQSALVHDMQFVNAGGQI